MSLLNRLVLSALIVAALPALADWPAYRGINNDGLSTEKILSVWPAAGPAVLWKAPIGSGIGSFAIVGDRAYYMALPTTGGTNEFCFAIDMKNGKVLWQTQVGPMGKARPSPGQGGPGPCSTPFFDGGKLYCYNSMINLVCLNAEDGKVVWKHDIQAEFGGASNFAQAAGNGISMWNSATSAVVEGDLCIVSGGGRGQSIIAFNKADGTVAWKKYDEIMTFSTPTLATIEGVRQLVFHLKDGLVSINPKTGDLLWKQAHPAANVTAASPVVSGNIVYCSSGYGIGGGAYKITKDGDNFSSAQMWYVKGQNMNQWSTPVAKDGYLYSIVGSQQTGNAPLKCVELATGKEKWSQAGIGQGEVLLIDGRLLIQAADGRLILADPNPTAYKELAKAQPLKGQAWGFPAYTNGVLIYRTLNEMAAVDLKP
jgi:outer membrane protein assembly factor BamB